MKFSSSLKFNAVPEWWDEYIAYDAMKKYIYQLEKQQAGLRSSYHDIEDGETAALIGSDGADTDRAFAPLLDREVAKIAAFYDKTVKAQTAEVQELEELVAQEEERGPGDRSRWDQLEGDDDEDEDDDEVGDLEHGRPPRSRSPEARRQRHASAHSDDMQDSLASLPPLATAQLHRSQRGGNSQSRSPTATRARRSLSGRLRDSILSSNLFSSAEGLHSSTWTSESNYAQDTRLLFKRKITNAYVGVSGLHSYVELNQTGFKKVLKKYDKVTENNLKNRYLSTLTHTSPFSEAARSELEGLSNRLIMLYTRCVTNGDASAATQALKQHQREHIAWERDTVWRTMINQARRGADDATVLEGTPRVVPVEEKKGVVEIQTRMGRIKITKKMVSLVVAVVVGTVLLNVQTLEGAEASRCLAVLVFCTIMWATEAIPLFVTSLCVPFFLVTLRVIRTSQAPYERLNTSDATKFIFSQMFSPTIMLLIGGFTIASALSKTAIDRVLITRVLSLAGTRPSTVLLAFMGVACFASMWISNVAAPTLCFTLIKPILRTLPAKSSFAPCLIIAIALAANIGGQASPISSPQNLIAMNAMDPKLDWMQWFAVSIPVSALSIVLIWLLLLVSYRPARHPGPGAEDGAEIEIKPIRASRDKFTLQQWWVSFVCVATIALWCVEHKLEAWLGDMGVIALIPVILFFATGVLKKDDFEQFAWSIVFLAMGGIALGKGVTSSGLLEVLDKLIRHFVDGLALYSVVLVLSLIVLVISTFISHTIAAVLLVPIAEELGRSLPDDHGNLLIFLTGLICSAGMGMPVSGFPNQTAAAQEDELGQLYLTNVDFLKNGVPASVIATLVVATIGFLLMKVVGL